MMKPLMILAALIAIVPAFKRMFELTGIALPWGTEQVVLLSTFVAEYLLFVPLVVVLGLAPLLRLSGEHDKTVRLASWTVGVAAFGTLCAWLAIAVLELIEKL